MGKFTLADVAPGTYDLTIDKSGWPSVKVCGVNVEAGKTTELPLRMMKMATPPSETTPPTLSVLPLPASGVVEIAIDAKDESGIYGVLLGPDQLMGRYFEDEPLPFPMSLGMDTTDYANGIHTLTVMVMDGEGNLGVSARAFLYTSWTKGHRRP